MVVSAERPNVVDAIYGGVLNDSDSKTVGTSKARKTLGKETLAKKENGRSSCTPILHACNYDYVNFYMG